MNREDRGVRHLVADHLAKESVVSHREARLQTNEPPRWIAPTERAKEPSAEADVEPLFQPRHSPEARPLGDVGAMRIGEVVPQHPLGMTDAISAKRGAAGERTSVGGGAASAVRGATVMARDARRGPGPGPRARCRRLLYRDGKRVVIRPPDAKEEVDHELHHFQRALPPCDRTAADGRMARRAFGRPTSCPLSPGRRRSYNRIKRLKYLGHASGSMRTPT